MQHNIASWASSSLSSQLNTKVEIGSIDLGFLNAIIINDLCIEDQSHQEMLKVARVSASFSIVKLITDGSINISTAQLFGTHARLYKQTPDSKYNFQFLIDAFKSNDDESKPIDLHINSLIVRHANITHDILSEERKSTIDPNHLNIKDAGFNLSLKQFTPDSLNATIKRLQATEANTGFTLKELAFHLEANTTHASLSDFILRLPHSSVTINDIDLNYADYNKDKSFAFSKTTLSSCISPSDIKPLLASLPDIAEAILLSIDIEGDNTALTFSNLLLHTQTNGISASINGTVSQYFSSSPSFAATINELTLCEGELSRWAALLSNNNESLTPLDNIGSVRLTGSVSKNGKAITSSGELSTDAGAITFTADIDDSNMLNAEIETTDIDVNRILGDERFGMLNLKADALLDLTSVSSIPLGSIQTSVNTFDYNGYSYHDITLDAINNGSDITLKLSSEDENANLSLDGTLTNIDTPHKTIEALLSVNNFSLRPLNLTETSHPEIYAFNLDTRLTYTDLNNLSGNIDIHDLTLTTPEARHTVNNISIEALLNGTADQHLQLTSDIADVSINGRFSLEHLAADFQNIIAYHLPSVMSKANSSSDSDLRYDVTFYDAPILHQFVNFNYTTEAPIHIFGSLTSAEHMLSMQCEANSFTYNDTPFKNLRINCNSSFGNMHVTASGSTTTDDSSTQGKIIAIVHNNKIDTDIQLHNKAKDDIQAELFATTTFSKPASHLMTKVQLSPSSIDINGSKWQLSPSVLSYSDNQLECRNFRISNGMQYLEVNGKASSNPNDSLRVTLNDMEVAYILDLVNFHSVEFGGKASGHATINNLFGQPDANANLFVHDFSLQDGIMGDANILAQWNKHTNGIELNAHIVDRYMSQMQLTGTKKEFIGVTEVNGYVSPEKEELDLSVMTQNTRADFLNGFLTGILSNIDGRINGLIKVVGPFSDVNVIGKPTADLSLTLNATSVPYYIAGDTIRLDYHSFGFKDINLHDRQNNTGILNGALTHRGFEDMEYRFDIDMKNLCAYNETEFNSDKFLAQVWANGDIHISGTEGHPLNIEANVSPSKGSLFAYDSATPDALVNSTFIDFNDITDTADQQYNLTSLLAQDDKTNTPINDQTTKQPNDQTVKPTYLGDIYMNINVDLTPNCEIKLRMDNTTDGYISTFGNGKFQAKWYNKGSFQLFGNYNITSGKYRLYLQDLVYRNLDIQDGSKVEFNGNPFDANLHLICKHEINSVPLSDLTATKAFSSNNKVKVDCYLDITGHLDNMDLSFKFELPNVSEETRQLVRSMINSDEEMNKQMIYLLGFQRFYPNQLAQNNIEEYGTQAVNSLISSTISGQINQVLSNMIGSSSKWNFGTGITTGENGWQDLDVEGILTGRLLNDRLLINGNFGYRDNSMTNQANFIGDFEVKYRIWESGDFYVKAYNQTNDRYFTKATLNTQGVGISFQHDFERYKFFNIFRRKHTEKNDSIKK